MLTFKSVLMFSEGYQMISKTAPGLKVSGSVIPGPYHNDHVTKTVIYKLKKG